MRLYPTPVAGMLPTTDPFEWRPRPPVLRGGAPGHVEMRLRVPPGFTVYRDQLVVRVVDSGHLQVGAPDIPPGVHLHDPAYNVEMREQYDSDVVVHIPVQSRADTGRGLESLQVFVRHQGCFHGHCFRPVEKVLNVHVPVRPGAPESPQPADVDAPPVPESAGPADPVPTPSFVVYVHGTPDHW